jgi:hypothetical protein
MQRKALRRESGVTTVESAIVLPLFLLLLIVTCDFVRVCWNQLSLQYALTQEMRVCQLALNLNANTIRADIDSTLQAFGMRLEAADLVTICPIGIFSTNPNCPEGSIVSGQPGELMAFGISKDVNLYFTSVTGAFSRRTLKLKATTLGRNEPE